jgi:hypothetical protein
MKKIFLFAFVLLSNAILAQNQNLIIDIQPVDFPFQNYAAKTVSNSVYPNFDVSGSDYLKSYVNPDMRQSIAVSSSFYNTMVFGLQKMKISWFKKDLFNRLTEATIYTSAVLLSEYLPLGDAWLHEEFHRAVLTRNYVNSYNQIYDFPLFSSLISVNRVDDGDLIRFKQKNPQDFVRLAAAGIEGEYMLMKDFQIKNFAYNQQIAYAPFEILWTFNSFYYVWSCHTNEAEEITDETNLKEGNNLKIRDFTGLDFTAWSYDLFKPFENYEDRGIHISGVGIDRYVKPSDLTADELKYLKKQGYLQLVNFVSPFLLGINKIPLSVDNSLYFNFAFRHLLTSFGFDVSADLFYFNKINYLATIHLYANNKRVSPGIDIQLIDVEKNIFSIKTKINLRLAGWLQPENLLFDDDNLKLGGLAEVKIYAGKKHFFPYFSLSTKTPGWVAGNVFQDKNTSIRAGISWFFSE